MEIQVGGVRIAQQGNGSSRKSRGREDEVSDESSYRYWAVTFVFLRHLASVGPGSAGHASGASHRSDGSGDRRRQSRRHNTATGVRYSSTTNGSGDYLLPFLMPGPYSLTVERPGFKTYTRTESRFGKATVSRSTSRCRLAKARRAYMSAPRRRCSTHPRPPWDRSSRAAPSSNCRAKTAWCWSWRRLSPGVTFTPQSAAYVRPFDTGSPSTMSINGTRNGSNEFMLDGASNMQGQQMAYSPPQAVVEEFKVQTTTFDAAFGFMPGAAVNMTLKSGGNSLHGQVNYFMQNPVLNANNFFRLAAGKPNMRIHRTNASLTGPVEIPKLYNGRNKTFFTLGFEWIYSFDPSPWVVEAVPTAAERKGDFSSLLRIGPQYQIYDPYSTTPAGNGHFTRTPGAEQYHSGQPDQSGRREDCRRCGTLPTSRARSTERTTTPWARMRRTRTGTSWSASTTTCRRRNGSTCATTSPIWSGPKTSART